MFSLFKKEGRMKEEASKAKRKHGICLTLIITVLVMVVSELAISFILILPLSFFTILSGNSELTSNILLEGDVGALMNLFLTIAPIIGIICFARYYMKRNWGSLGLFKRNVIRDYGKGLFIGLLMMAVAVGIAFLFGGLEFKGAMRFSIGMLLLYFIAFMIQGFSEELLTRGFMMNSISARYSMPFAIMINSLFFAVLHLANSGISFLAFINIFLAGVTFSLLALYYDNVIVCSAAHSMWNFAQGNIFGVLVSGIFLPTSVLQFSNVENMSFLNGGNFGLEGGIAVFIVEIVSIGILCYAYMQKQKKAKRQQVL